MKLDCQGIDFTSRMCGSFYRESDISLWSQFLRRFFRNACLQREFVIWDFYLPRREKYPEKVIWMTFQTNIKLYLFRDEFPVEKKIFDKRYGFNFFLAKRVNIWRSRHACYSICWEKTAWMTKSWPRKEPIRKPLSIWGLPCLTIIFVLFLGSKINWNWC